MRELKFRVYDKDLGKYLEGCEIDSLMAELSAEGNGREVIIKQLCPARYIFEQDTGLFDWNSTKIHEGDIVRYVSVDGEYLMAQVEFDECCFETDYEEGATFLTGFALRNVKDAIKPTDISDDDWEDWMDGLREDCQVEVIGNIHENPELLKEKEW